MHLNPVPIFLNCGGVLFTTRTGGTEGTMCGECTQLSGLHVPEDLVHLDVYNSHMQSFVPDGECGRGVLTTLLPVGGKCGTLLINYDTEDTTSSPFTGAVRVRENPYENL